MKIRSSEPEIIDLGPSYYTQEEYDDCLIKLDGIGRWLGGDRATFAALKELDRPPDSILDVGCGGGLFTMRLARRYPHAKIVGIDLNPSAIDFAKRRMQMLKNPPANLIFETRMEGQLAEPAKSYDVVLSTLVCHHLSDDHLIDFFARTHHIAKKKVIINDLHRHPLAYVLFKMIGPIFFPNRLVQNDGLLSIRKAFTREELYDLFERAGLRPSQCSINWCWAFRWLAAINCEELPA